MLLGALADLGYNPPEIFSAGRVQRMSIDCTLADAGPDTEDKDKLYERTIEDALKALGADYVMCSHLPLPDNADGEVISALENGGISVTPAAEAMGTDPVSARLLARLVAECGPKPAMDIIGVGYGADPDNEESFLCVTLGSYGVESIFLETEVREYV